MNQCDYGDPIIINLYKSAESECWSETLKIWKFDKNLLWFLMGECMSLRPI